MAFKQATVNASDIPSTQSNFPAYVDLSRLGITTLAEAQSVRCYADESKVTELAREIVSVTEMHVKIPSLTSTFVLYVEYDGVSSDYAVTDTYGRNAVWSDYELVYHMNDTTTTQTDSTGHGGDALTEMSNPTEGVTGAIGNAVSYDNNDSHRQTTYPVDALSALSVSAWVKPNNFSTQNPIAAMGDVYAGGYRVAWAFINLPTGANYMSVYKTLSPTVRIESSSSTSLTSGAWNHVAATWNPTGGVVKHYLAGSPDGTNSNASVNAMVNLSTTYDKFYIGRTENQFGDQYMDGSIDELRVREAVLSDDWYATEYNNQSDESTFWGTWTDVGGGDNTTGFFYTR